MDSAASTTAATADESSENTTSTDDELSCGDSREPGITPGCALYSFIVCTVIMGLLAVFGSIGNVISFAVFYRDKIKTSTNFLFQVVSARFCFFFFCSEMSSKYISQDPLGILEWVRIPSSSPSVGFECSILFIYYFSKIACYFSTHFHHGPPQVTAADPSF